MYIRRGRVIYRWAFISRNTAASDECSRTRRPWGLSSVSGVYFWGGGDGVVNVRLLEFCGNPTGRPQKSKKKSDGFIGLIVASDLSMYILCVCVCGWAHLKFTATATMLKSYLYALPRLFCIWIKWWYGSRWRWWVVGGRGRWGR